MNNYQAKQYVDQVLQGKFELMQDKNSDCEYFKDKHCVATQQKTCKNCRFFTPNYSAKLRRLAELYAEAEGINIELNDSLKYSNKEINLLRQRLNGKDAE